MENDKFLVGKPLTDTHLVVLEQLISLYGMAAVTNGIAKIADNHIKSAKTEIGTGADKTKLKARIRQWERAKSRAEAMTQDMLEIGPGSGCN